MSLHPVLAASPLWVVTSYFNPAGYRRRLDNYRVFRRLLRAPLLTVELAFGAPPELGRDDADILMHCDGGDVMWQKERLLNHALRYLPAACSAVAWIDCDVVLEHSDWPARAMAALDRHALIQLFDRLHHPARDAPVEQVRAMSGWTRPGLVAEIARGRTVDDAMHESLSRAPGSATPGIAWAARRELLDRLGLYDLCIVGGGDNALAMAALGEPQRLIRRHDMNAAQQSAYLEWAVPFAAAVDGGVSHIEQAIAHLWHGDFRHRQSVTRHAALRSFDFEPRRDVAVAPCGAWRWSSDKPALHDFMRGYFRARREDGPHARSR